MLIYPLCPFFVIFCNVVYTSDVEDVSLMREVTQGLSPFLDRNIPVSKLHRLCTKFLTLCSPMTQSHLAISRCQSLPDLDLSDDTTRHMQCQVHSSHENKIGESNNGQIHTNQLQGVHEHLNKSEESTSGEDAMWELFLAQPWLGWAEWDSLSNPLPIE